MTERSTRHIGFTGTQRGMTPEQRARLGSLLIRLDDGWLHHGDCIGADADAHGLAVEHGIKVAIHPPSNGRKRAFCKGDLLFEPMGYLARNREIVNATVALLATPAGFDEELRSGTWSTIRYARHVRKPRVIVFPDGSVRNER